MTDKRFWELVKKIGWGTKSTDYEKLGVDLVYYINDKEELFDLRSISMEKRVLLNDVIYDKDHKMRIDTSLRFWGGDDSYWDFCAHIVGLGEDYFNEVLKDPNYVSNLGSRYKENFEYTISRAEEYCDTPEGKKILKKNYEISKRGPKLERILNDK